MEEERTNLSTKTQDLHRAIESLREEVQAVDVYNQRADACSDERLKKIILHNAKEEKEHASMLLEWIRQQDGDFDHELKSYLFSDKDDISHHD